MKITSDLQVVDSNGLFSSLLLLSLPVSSGDFRLLLAVHLTLLPRLFAGCFFTVSWSFNTERVQFYTCYSFFGDVMTWWNTSSLVTSNFAPPAQPSFALRFLYLADDSTTMWMARKHLK